MESSAALAELTAIRCELEAAVECVFDCVESISSCLTQTSAGSVDLAGRVQDQLNRIVEAMSFQDITGQRLTRVTQFFEQTNCETRDAPLTSMFSLENGPALPGDGLSQSDADSLLAERA